MSGTLEVVPGTAAAAVTKGPSVDEATSRSQVDEPSTRRRLRPMPPPLIFGTVTVNFNNTAFHHITFIQYK